VGKGFGGWGRGDHHFLLMFFWGLLVKDLVEFKFF
jgi:hypothetical protein